MTPSPKLAAIAKEKMKPCGCERPGKNPYLCARATLLADGYKVLEDDDPRCPCVCHDKRCADGV